MADVRDQPSALQAFTDAQQYYREQRFDAARETMAAYRAAVDYEAFPRQDRRPAGGCIHSSVVLVSFGSGAGLLECLRSLQTQLDPHFEIILVDQGGNEAVHAELARWPLLWIRPPINLLPSEGRNLGAHFATGEWLIFLDDDAIAGADFIAQAWFGMQRTQALALRGRILPRSEQAAAQVGEQATGQDSEQTADDAPPAHYDLGPQPRLAAANIEGNLVLRRTAFEAVRGFDPLVFGHEGRELGWRLHQARRAGPLETTGARGIYYWPWLTIRHAFATGVRLQEKRARQERGQAYLDAFAPGASEPPEQMDAVLSKRSAEELAAIAPPEGVTLLLRARADGVGTQRLLESLVAHLRQDQQRLPLELIILAPEMTAMVALIRPFLAQLKISVLSARRLARMRDASDLVSLGRYAQLGFVAPDAVFSSDSLPRLVATLHASPLVAGVRGPGALAERLLLCPRWALGCLLGEPADAPVPALAKRLLRPSASAVV